MGSVTDLLNFRANDLFPDETIDWGCEKHKEALASDEGSEKSYYMVNEKKVYCEFASRNEMEVQLKRKRVSLKRAIEVYLEEVS
jgi:predicted Zn-dependent protease